MSAPTYSPDTADRTIMRNAVKRLSGRLPELSDRLFTEILAGEDSDRPIDSRDDLFEVCRAGLGYGIEAILDPSRRRCDLQWAERLGHRRAEQGLPLDQLLRSYRLAGRIFWDGLVEVVSEDEPAHIPALARRATYTWHAIEQQSTAVAAAYHRTEYELLRRSEERVHAALDALLEGRGGDGGLLATASSILGLPPQGRYAVVVLENTLARGGQPRPAETGGLRFIWRLRAEAQHALVGLGTAELDDLVEVLRPQLRGPAGVSPVVEGLASLGKARWLAELALRTCRSDGPEIARLDQRLPDALVVSQPELSGYLGTEVLAAFSGADPAYRDILLDTFEAWLDCAGSAAQAATRLYCHQNTVLNRLRRIERLTGRDLRKPRELIELALALSAFRHRADQRG